MSLSHVDRSGRARMVDIGAKPPSVRTALAAGVIRMAPAALDLVEEDSGPKGHVLATAELAGVTAAKRTGELIPLCHPLPLDYVRVSAVADRGLTGVRVEAEVKAEGKTGVEMEALTAVAAALLTVYDMVKAAGHTMEIGDIRLLEKTGGTSGDWRRQPET